MIFRSLYFLCLLFILNSCGYRPGQGGMMVEGHTISIPYVEGDWNGAFTAILIRKAVESGAFSYRKQGGTYLLNVRIVDQVDDHIGFRYDRTKHGRIRNALIPDETRTTLSVDVELVEACTGLMIMGPVRISADIEFDHDYYSPRDGVNVFSLGQLTDIDAAEEAAMEPLYNQLSQKIIDYVLSN